MIWMEDETNADKKCQPRGSLKICFCFTGWVKIFSVVNRALNIFAYVVIQLAMIFVELNFVSLFAYSIFLLKGSICRELLALFFHKMECLHFVCSRFAKEKVGVVLDFFVRKYDFVYGCSKNPRRQLPVWNTPQSYDFSFYIHVYWYIS